MHRPHIAPTVFHIWHQQVMTSTCFGILQDQCVLSCCSRACVLMAFLSHGTTSTDPLAHTSVQSPMSSHLRSCWESIQSQHILFHALQHTILYTSDAPERL